MTIPIGERTSERYWAEVFFCVRVNFSRGVISERFCSYMNAKREECIGDPTLLIAENNLYLYTKE